MISLKFIVKNVNFLIIFTITPIYISLNISKNIKLKNSEFYLFNDIKILPDIVNHNINLSKHETDNELSEICHYIVNYKYYNISRDRHLRHERFKRRNFIKSYHNALFNSSFSKTKYPTFLLSPSLNNIIIRCLASSVKNLSSGLFLRSSTNIYTKTTRIKRNDIQITYNNNNDDNDIKDSKGSKYKPINFLRTKPLKYAVPFLGYAGTALIFITLITNSFIVIVLLHKHMRTPTNTLLACMAISDMLTGLFPLPWMIHFYILRGYKEPVNLAWCKYFSMGVMHIPTIFHTASIWLITTLAVQRYLYVCYSAIARSWCTIPKVLMTVAIIYTISVLYNLPRFFEQVFTEIDVDWNYQLREWGYSNFINDNLSHINQYIDLPSIININSNPFNYTIKLLMEAQDIRNILSNSKWEETILNNSNSAHGNNIWLSNNYKNNNFPKILVSHCAFHTSGWLIPLENIFYNLYYWFRVVFVHVVPCTSLVVLNGLLIHAMRKAIERRQRLLVKDINNQNKKNTGTQGDERKVRETNSTTHMLVLVVTVFLIVEIPLGIIFVLHIIENTFEIPVMNYDVATVLSIMIDFSILASYPLNFFIYCRMSKQFRDTFNHFLTITIRQLIYSCVGYCCDLTDNSLKKLSHDNNINGKKKKYFPTYSNSLVKTEDLSRQVPSVNISAQKIYLTVSKKNNYLASSSYINKTHPNIYDNTEDNISHPTLNITYKLPINLNNLNNKLNNNNDVTPPLLFDYSENSFNDFPKDQIIKYF